MATRTPPKYTPRQLIMLGIAFVALVVVFVWRDALFGAGSRVEPASPSQPTKPVEVSLKDLPSNRLFGIGGTVNAQVNGSVIALTLQAYRQTALTDFPLERRFETTFEVVNQSDQAVTFAPSLILQGANNSGFRLSRGGAVDLVTTKATTLGPKATQKVVLEWRTKPFNMTSGKQAPQTVWIAVNTPISENGTVVLQEDTRVFLVNF
jgi:hypothetical protein